MRKINIQIKFYKLLFTDDMQANQLNYKDLQLKSRKESLLSFIINGFFNLTFIVSRTQNNDKSDLPFQVQNNVNKKNHFLTGNINQKQ